MSTQETRTALERHISTGLQAIIVILVSWVGITVVQVSEDVARLQEQLTGSVMTRIDVNHTILIDHEQRLRALERRRP